MYNLVTRCLCNIFIDETESMFGRLFDGSTNDNGRVHTKIVRDKSPDNTEKSDDKEIASNAVDRTKPDGVRVITDVIIKPGRIKFYY